jgi:Family of unknown function (DUF6113)
VNIQQAQADGGRARPFGSGPVVTACAYLALLVLGAVEGLIGTFHYSGGPAPLAAVCFAGAILATCLLGAWGMRSGAGGLAPAAGWVVTTLLLSSGKGGSILITNTTAGQWFLFGGALFAAGGAVIGFALWSKASHARRAERQKPK